MFAQVNHPGLGLLMDPTNYFETHNIDKQQQVLGDVFDSLGDRVRIAHAKDVKRSGDDKTEKHADIGDANALESHTFSGVGEIELPAAGLGELDYEFYVKRLSEKSPNVPLIIEHLDESDVPRAKQFIDGILTKIGV
jgi:sugar phosphate isomerase/epimerase